MTDDSFAAGLVGIVLDGRYRLDGLLGEGGMGAVFRAHHLAMDRRVAVKLLKPHLTNDDAALQRFAREARATLKVDSPHAVKLLDFGVTPQRDYYMVLEYLDGRTVQRELTVDGPFAPARVVHIARHALAALAAAHNIGLIHRDIKPDNILLMRVGDDPDFAMVLDFGVAKLMEGAARSSQSALQITQAGMVFGTPEFMSPEQACGNTLDTRSDLYSLAATMFAMLTGCGMYQAKTAIEWLTSHARTPAPHLADGLAELAAFPELDAVLQRCLAKRREDRPSTAEEMAQLLVSIEPTLSRAPGAPVEHPTTPGRAMKATLFSPSTFIPALPELPESHGGAAQSMHRIFPPPTTGVHPPAGRRGLWLGLGALVIAGMMVAVIAVAGRSRAREVAPRPIAKPAAAIADAAAFHDDASMPAAIPIDATVAPDAGSGAHLPIIPHPNTAALQHLALAEEAKRTGNHLKQMSEADAALRANPHNARARFLLADALLATGDLDRGCKYLRDLGRNPAAVARARTAGCPGN